MKRFHVHVSVDDLTKSIAFYSGLFGMPPSVQRPDYAKWMLNDPRINFAISERGRKVGVDHLGLQVESNDELGEVRDRLVAAEASVLDQTGAACCYAKSNKHWTVDPQGIAWETFHSLAEIPVYGADAANPAADAVEKRDSGACCVPAAVSAPATAGTATPVACCTPEQRAEAKATKAACCG